MTIVLKNNTYLVQFPYDPMLIQMFKNSIPSAGRRWDHNNKMWQVDTQYENVLKQLFPNDRVPVANQVKSQSELRVIDLRYLGQVKDRGNGEQSAFGFAGGNWSVIFPERTLRAWFEGLDNMMPGDMSTFYGILGVARAATEAEIKTGYKRMVKQWHPDVCREPNAHEMFLKIRDAYDVLSNPKKKSRYDVGLALTANQPVATPASGVYRSPLRCGYVLAEGMSILDRFMVAKIVAWEDILDGSGRTLVTSWLMGDDKPTENWV